SISSRFRCRRAALLDSSMAGHGIPWSADYGPAGLSSPVLPATNDLPPNVHRHGIVDGSDTCPPRLSYLPAAPGIAGLAALESFRGRCGRVRTDMEPASLVERGVQLVLVPFRRALLCRPRWHSLSHPALPHCARRGGLRAHGGFGLSQFSLCRYRLRG